MPAINIRFTEAELVLLRARAAFLAKPVSRLIHDDSLEAVERDAHRQRVAAANDKVAERSAEVERRLA
jgi:hypothetical protein